METARGGFRRDICGGPRTEIRRHLPRAGDKWHLDEIVIKIAGTTRWLWRAVDQHGIVLGVLVHSRRDAKAAERLPRKLLKRQGRAPWVMVADKLASYPAAKKEKYPASGRAPSTPASISPPRVSLTHNHQVDGAGVLVHRQRMSGPEWWDRVARCRCPRHGSPC